MDTIERRKILNKENKNLEKLKQDAKEKEKEIKTKRRIIKNNNERR